MGKWFNPDGLLVKLGPDEASDQDPKYFLAGELKVYGKNRETEYTIDLTKLNAFGTVTILNDNSFFGKGWVAERVEIETLVAATGTGATLSVGLVKNSDRTTAVSATAFAAAVPLADIAAVGTRLDLTAGSDGAGAYIGVANTDDALVTATVGTANFTAGRIKVRINWRPTVNQ